MRSLLIHCAKRRLIELVKPEPVSVLIRKHSTPLEDQGETPAEHFLGIRLSSIFLALKQKLYIYIRPVN